MSFFAPRPLSLSFFVYSFFFFGGRVLGFWQHIKFGSPFFFLFSLEAKRSLTETTTREKTRVTSEREREGERERESTERWEKVKGK